MLHLGKGWIEWSGYSWHYDKGDFLGVGGDQIMPKGSINLQTTEEKKKEEEERTNIFAMIMIMEEHI